MPNVVYLAVWICIWIHIVECDLESLFQRCCDVGKTKSTEPLKCDGKVRTPIAGVAVEQQAICLSTIDLCCIQFLRDIACESGKLAARQNKNCVVSSKTDDGLNYKHCCEACKLGLITSTMGMDCNLKTFRFNSPWDNSYESCCSEYTRSVVVAEPANICELLPGELCSHICVPVKGSYKCRCRAGYTLMADGKSCQQETTENRCERYKPCDQNCFDNGENMECSCNSGYELLADNTTCVDINECNLKLDNCYLSGKTCQNTIGGYKCVGLGKPDESTPIVKNSFPDNSDSTTKPSHKSTCLVGYKFDTSDGQCVDIDECKTANICNGNAETCLNTEGSYRCISKTKCPIGYVYNQQTKNCTDENECEQNPCDSSYENCVNLIGSFTCNCNVGFQRDGVTGACVDVNECQLRRHHCEASQRCDNTVGSYHCVRVTNCGTGYTLNSGTNICEDDDECALNLDNCKQLGPGWECRNLLGSFRCEKAKRCDGVSVNCTKITTTECPKGYEFGNGVCTDIDECRRKNSCRPDQSCLNTEGGYKCVTTPTCTAGLKYSDDQTHCIDIDECKEQPNVCDHRCINVWGSFRCSCNAGYIIHNDDRSCIDINECELFKERRLCMGYCINTPGSYKCQCPDGYKLGINGVMCEDIDECATGRLCTKPNEMCINMRGSYRCNSINCPPNYIQDTTNKNRCVRMQNFCVLYRDCAQMPLSYSFNYLTFPSNILLPVSGQQDLFHMRGPPWPTATQFSLDLKSVQAPAGVNKTNRDYFRLNHDSANEVTISLIRPIQGPQDIELDLKMQYTTSGTYSGFVNSKLFIYVSQYEF